METLEPVRCFFTLLTRIRIENTWMETIPLATILQNCSCLLHLDVESTFHRAQEETSTTGHGALRCEEKTLSRIVLPESAFSTTLTRLNLSKIKIGLWALERLLLSCRTRSQSNLLDLTLKHIVIEESPSLAGGKTTVCSDPQPIVDHIHQWCPSLRCLHFSMFDYKPTQLNQAHLFKRFSAVQKWGIPHSDILPSTFLSLQAYVNHVTALELTCSCDGLVPLALHEYLCNSPQLRNLWVSNILFPAEYLDLDPVAVNKAGCYSPRYCHDESSSLDTKRAKSVGPTSLTLWLQKRVWACRNLETLQIKFDGLVGDTRAARNSRVMFSYLALVCPHLRELRITRDKMNLELEGGLCYLGALEELEKLILQTKHIWIKHVSDIEWIRLQSATAEAAAAAARTRKTMGAITGSNRISRLDSGISRTTTRTTLASRGGVPFQRSKTWMSREGGKRNLLSRLVGQLLERGPRRLLGLNRETGEMTRTRTIADQQGADSSAGDGHPRSMEEKTIIQRLISMSKPGNVGKAVERMERNKVRAEARQDEDEVGYCWPDMEMLVLDAAKYSGISDESLEQTACTATAANMPKILVPLVQQTLAEIASGAMTVPAPTSTAKCQSTQNSRFADQVRFIRRLREALYKGSVLCGGPYGINALGAVNFALDHELSAAVNEYGPVRSYSNTASPEEYQERGRNLFQTIYQHHTDPILTKIGSSSQDLVQSILRDTYGKVLSDTSLISIPETELCLVASLVPLNVPPQLKSHVYGARNVGVPMEQVQQLVAVAESITRWIHSQVNDKSSL
ncbi:hypothetical protein BGX28_004436 [Mortierella sp. GBA30]|nr:hypothetical protein BGX28_004436 [Mortierella sp. GBA30]